MMGGLVEGFLYAALGEDEGRAVEIVREGEFVDRHGRPVTVTAEDVEAYAAAFAAGARGQEVPIDVNHERNEAAGWFSRMWVEVREFVVNGATQTFKVLNGLPEWNELGRQLVGERIYQYLSATLDLEKKEVVSASLTNFPAVKGLRPVELGEGVMGLRAMGGLERLKAGLAALVDQILGQGEEAEMGEPARRMVKVGEYLQAKIHASFTSIADELAAAGMLTVDERKALSGAIGAALESFAQTAGDAGERVVSVMEPYYLGERELSSEEGEAMTEQERAALRKQVRVELEAELAAQAQTRAELREEVVAEVRTELEERMVRDRALAEFAASVCGGEHGLSAEPSEVVAVLSALPGEMVERGMTLLQARVVDFGVHGSSRDGAGGLEPVPQEYRGALARWVEAGQPLDEFFRLVAPDVDRTKLDLSEYKPRTE